MASVGLLVVVRVVGFGVDTTLPFLATNPSVATALPLASNWAIHGTSSMNTGVNLLNALADTRLSDAKNAAYSHSQSRHTYSTREVSTRIVGIVQNWDRTAQHSTAQHSTTNG